MSGIVELFGFVSCVRTYTQSALVSRLVSFSLSVFRVPLCVVLRGV
jgi:hypothetical protein